METTGNNRNFRWYNIALISFTAVWGLNNVVNNFANQGLVVIVSWLLIMALYFIPYTLMVGQLGATFQDAEGGVSSWMKELSTSRWAYLAAWTYWIVHVPYLAQKPQAILIGFSWLFQSNGNFVNQTPSYIVQALSLVIFLIFLWMATKGVTTLNRVGSIAGIGMFTMSILFIILGLAAPFIAHSSIATAHMDQVSTYMPKFNFNYFTTISMLVFAVGGAEKISPYVNKTRNPSKEFPLGMILLAIMVALSAVLGSFAMGMIFDADHIPNDLMANGSYTAFQILGNYFHVGNLLTWIFAISNILSTSAALAISVDAPLRIFLNDADKNFVPASLRRKNKNGIAINGYKLTGILVSIIIIVPALGIGGMNDLYNWLMNLNSVVMPMRYLWVFVAYMLLSKQIKKFNSDYVFVKNSKIGFAFGLWCFLFTAFACILGVIPKIDYAANPTTWWFQLAMNIITPFVLIALRVIMPMIAKRQVKEEL